jgi:hypothetical protein
MWDNQVVLAIWCPVENLLSGIPYFVLIFLRILINSSVYFQILRRLVIFTAHVWFINWRILPPSHKISDWIGIGLVIYFYFAVVSLPILSFIFVNSHLVLILAEKLFLGIVLLLGDVFLRIVIKRHFFIKRFKLIIMHLEHDFKILFFILNSRLTNSIYLSFLGFIRVN